MLDETGWRRRAFARGEPRYRNALWSFHHDSLSPCALFHAATPIRIRFARANPRRLSSRAEKKRILRFPKEQFSFSKYLSFPRYCATGKKEGKFFQRRLSPFHEKKKNNTRFNKYLYIREKMSILTYYMYITLRSI